MSYPSRPSGRVQVFARTRPTANFPLDMIQLESDKKVGPEIHVEVEMWLFYLAVIDHVDSILSVVVLMSFIKGLGGTVDSPIWYSHTEE